MKTTCLNSKYVDNMKLIKTTVKKKHNSEKCSYCYKEKQEKKSHQSQNNTQQTRSDKTEPIKHLVLIECCTCSLHFIFYYKRLNNATKVIT